MIEYDIFGIERLNNRFMLFKMMLFSNIDEDSKPESLVGQCLNAICKNLNAVYHRTERGYVMKANTPLPDELCQLLMHTYQKSGGVIDDKFANIFANNKKTQLSKAVIWNSTISNIGLHSFLKRRLEELTIGYCGNITFKVFEIIDTYGGNLVKLKLDHGIPYLKYFPDSYRNSNLEYFSQRGYVFKIPKLEHLTLKNCCVPDDSHFFSVLLSSVPNLKYLDLSGSMGLNDFNCLKGLKQLKALILHDVPNIMEAIPHICKLKKLEHLDISHSTGTIYRDENDTLAFIVDNLPNLTSLDISGTNLAGTGAVQPHLFKNYEISRSDIPGLISRSQTPLEFLGLYSMAHGPCHRFEIPAKQIAGDATEKQLLVAGRAYMYRPAMLLKVLGDLFHFLRHKNHEDTDGIIRIILDSLDIHAQDKNVQISGSAIMFSLFKSRDTLPLSPYTKRKIIKTMLQLMITHDMDDVIVRNGCLTLCQFNVPHDFLFIYDELVKFLLHIITHGKMEGFIQRITMYLLNSLACQVDDTQKHILGDLNVIERMLSLVRHRVSFHLCDDVLEIAWSTMWNVTDETPINCKRFLDSDGMSCFTNCLEMFQDKSELMRNMMGLLGNVAEVAELRPRLMSYIPVFYHLLESDQDGIEVSYNAAGVLAHLASDGIAAWEITFMKRDDVLNKMVQCIEKWSILSERNINYRSFKPILKLAACDHTPACQHWAVWALANLTTVYLSKYCPIIEKEDGVKILHNIVLDQQASLKIKELASVVIENCILCDVQ